MYGPILLDWLRFDAFFTFKIIVHHKRYYLGILYFTCAAFILLIYDNVMILCFISVDTSGGDQRSMADFTLHLIIEFKFLVI